MFDLQWETILAGWTSNTWLCLKIRFLG